MKKNVAVTLTEEEIQKVKDLVSEGMEDLQGTLLLGIHVLIAKSFKSDKVEAALNIASNLFAVSD